MSGTCRGALWCVGVAFALVVLGSACGDPASEASGPSSDEQVPTDDGTAGGACYGNGTCNYGLFCNTQSMCEPIPGAAPGERGGVCLPNGGCDIGLTCRVGDICLPETGGEGTQIGDEAPPETDEIIVGEVDWEDIRCDPDGEGAERWACSVAYLSINSRSRCTAWLVAPGVIATNNHCIASQDEITEVLATFNFEAGVAREDFDAFICEDFLATSPELDLTLLGCTAKSATLPGERYGWFEIDFETPIEDDDRLAIVHQNCLQGPFGCENIEDRPDKKLSLGRVLLAEHTDLSFRHSADTLGGSSGSPVIDPDTGKVRGIHFAGVKAEQYNVATAATNFLQYRRICDVLSPGQCDGVADLPPGQPKVSFVTFDAVAGQEFVIYVRSGTDPNAREDVQVRCVSEGSNIGPDSPYQSAWGEGGGEERIGITWAAPGLKDIQCTTHERDGDASVTILVAVDVRSGTTTDPDDDAPSAPSIERITQGEVEPGDAVELRIQDGVDPEGNERVQTQCYSPGSGWTDGAPFATPLTDQAAASAVATFVWDSPGAKIVTCYTVEEDGHTSAAATLTLNVSGGAGDAPPTLPVIFGPDNAIEGVPVEINVRGGEDPEGVKATQLRCFSPDSTWPEAFPLETTPRIGGPHDVIADFTWSTPGLASIFCVALEIDGQASDVVRLDILVTEAAGGGDVSPTEPVITAPASAQVGVPASVQIRSGVDPNGTEQVRVQCVSTGSQWTSGAEYSSAFGDGDDVSSVEFTWSTPGEKLIFCSTVEFDGDASFSASAAVQVD